MNASVLLFGVLPLLAFVVIDALAGLRSGVLAAIFFAVAEAAYTLWEFGTIDSLTIGSLVLVLVFGLISYRSNKAIYMKLQPVFLGVSFGLILLVTQALNNPLLVMMAVKYQYMFPEQMRANLVSPMMLAMLAKLSWVLAIGFLVHAALVAYSAYRMSNWWWLAIRGIGLYVMMAICVVAVRIQF